MKRIIQLPRRTAAGLILAAVAFALPQLQGIEITQAPPSTPLGQSFLEALGEPFDQGRILYNGRMRFENADQDGFRSSEAFTFRNRLGYETPRFNGIYALVEGEYNWVLNNDKFGAYPPPHNAGHTVIADPENLALNRFLLGYEIERTTFILGRQDINLGNQRFIGTVGWRQNDQTFDAFRIRSEALPHLVLDYTWNWKVHRVFGSHAPTPELRRLHSDNHLVSARFSGLEIADIGLYAHALRMRDLPAHSSDTFGFFLDGSVPFHTDYALLYRAEFAHQVDNRNTSGDSYAENYLSLQLAAARQGYEIGAGFEQLDGNGEQAFQTPLATLHAFNGWADTFLTTPPHGLRDFSIWASGSLGREITARLEGRYYRAEDSSLTYGHEVGLMLSRPLSPNLTALVKAAHYDGRSGAGPLLNANNTKLWIQLDFRL